MIRVQRGSFVGHLEIKACRDIFVPIISSQSNLIFLKVEYLSLSRDTTETDIKQRRELVSGNAIYKDAAAVRAAMNGRVLILDGVERVERNVLPGLGLENFRVLKRF